MNDMTKAEPSVAVHKSIAAALARAQSQMGKALKQSNNPHFKSKYADLSSVMDACMPSLTANGIAVIQPTVDEDGERFVKTVLIHGETGETLECRTPLIVQKNDMQGYMSAVTYGRRCGLMCMGGIAPEDDDGNAAVIAAPTARARQDDTGPSAGEANAAASSLSNADTLDRLRIIWTDLPRPIQSIPAVIKAKDARKAELDAIAAKQPADDLGGDVVPY
jgi:hypothetical protein